MMKQKTEQVKRNSYKISKMRVYVYSSLPGKCPNCNSVLSRQLFQINHGNMKNPEGKVCNNCHKVFLSVNAYYKHNKYFEALNQKEVKILIEEIEKQRQEKYERRRKKEEEKKSLKQALVDLIEQRIQKAGVQDVPGWKIIKNSSQKVLYSMVGAFLVEKNLETLHWYFMTGEGRKNNHVSNNLSIIGSEGIMGRTLLEYGAKGEKQFNFVDDTYCIKSIVIFDDKYYDELVKPYRKEIRDGKDKTQIKKVYVYFRLNNKCIIKKHKIITVTAKTTNVKTGLNAEVNVFYCTECDKYFINYEALHKYVSKGIYPAFAFSVAECDDSKLRDVSDLMLYGYNVREGILTESERHRILSWIIDAGLLSKADIIKDLQFKVNYNGKKAGNENAKKKWQEDIQFVSRYVKGNTISIGAEFKR